MRLLHGGWGAGLLDGGTRSRVYWVGREVYMGVYYANLSRSSRVPQILGSGWTFPLVYTVRHKGHITLDI